MHDTLTPASHQLNTDEMLDLTVHLLVAPFLDTYSYSRTLPVSNINSTERCSVIGSRNGIFMSIIAI